MRTLIKNACLILTDRLIRSGWLVIENSLIDDFGDGTCPDGHFDEVLDAQGKYVSPGFVDTHVHGAVGQDFTESDTDGILEAMRHHFLHGTTTMLPTLTSVKHEQYVKSLENFRSLLPVFAERNDIPEFGGIHMEGPYCSGAALGAQNTSTYRDPDYREIELYLEMAPYIKKWTAAPERNGGMDFGRFLEKKGIVASIGHSNATYEQVLHAYECGYHHITHLYSACSFYHREGAYRKAGIVEAAWMLDNMDVEMITDGIHLPKEFLQLIYKIKGADHISMITDAIRYCGVDVPDGSFVPYTDGDSRRGVIIEGGVAMVPERTCFAGSIATADRLLKTAVNVAGIGIVDAVKMLSATPARINGLTDIGQITRGKKANLLILDSDLNICTIILRGKKAR
ncbi:MAG: amidohydrolase family protein [Sphaerochaetaceae bacterium]|nr:amidohydrolase family protein [Sphaerochaetaceae bacterium]